jgi:hypothetical protein
MTGGSFVSEAEFSALSERSKAYVKYYLRKLEQLKGVVK